MRKYIRSELQNATAGAQRTPPAPAAGMSPSSFLHPPGAPSEGPSNLGRMGVGRGKTGCLGFELGPDAKCDGGAHLGMPP